MKTFEEIIATKKVIVASKSPDGFRGNIYIRGWVGTLVVSWGCGWDHVSVSPAKSNYTPTWDDMCAVKDLFFKDDEAVIQIHPPKSEYINLKENCLHLWRRNDADMVLPPSWMVGLKDGQTMADALREAKEYREKYGYEY